MKVTPVVCGPAANESELKALESLKTRLISMDGNDEWYLLTNLAFSVTHQLQSDEIDIIAIGPPGVRVIEVKHWRESWVTGHSDLVEHEANKVTNKAKKIAGVVRKVVPNPPFVGSAILLTREPSKLQKIDGDIVLGVRFHTLNGWNEVLNLESPSVLTPLQVRQIAEKLFPKSSAVAEGSLRRLAGYVNLELQTPRDERFHRIYHGSHSTSQDKAVLHLYDLSASDANNAEARARREFEALHKLQLNEWAPRILDSYQRAPGYEGEMFFFTVVDPAAPSIAGRTADSTWDTHSRIAFSLGAIRALQKFHSEGDEDTPFVHRNLTPITILVRYDNSPILTGFERARVPAAITVASSEVPDAATEEDTPIAPEVLQLGLGAADQRSDIYSLCASLLVIFQNDDDETVQFAAELLRQGLAEDPTERVTLEDLQADISSLLGESSVTPTAPPARYWTEEQVVPFRDQDYRIVSRLGSGGVGITFKVIEVDRSTQQDIGSYVAKVAYNAEVGQRVIGAYQKVRPYIARHPNHAPIFDYAHEWQDNQFVALMAWIEGVPLIDLRGVFSLWAEENLGISDEDLAISWLTEMCSALDAMHRNGLAHGDVSPRNMIVSGESLVLTDYDFAGKLDEAKVGPGTLPYCAPETPYINSASGDLFALASSFFHVVFDKKPFQYGGVLEKSRGVNWEGIDKSAYPIVAKFIDKATHPDASQRISSVAQARSILEQPSMIDEASIIDVDGQPEPAPTPDNVLPTESTTRAQNGAEEASPERPQVHYENSVPWLHSYHLLNQEP